MHFYSFENANNSHTWNTELPKHSTNKRLIHHKFSHTNARIKCTHSCTNLTTRHFQFNTYILTADFLFGCFIGLYCKLLKTLTILRDRNVAVISYFYKTSTRLTAAPLTHHKTHAQSRCLVMFMGRPNAFKIGHVCGL